MRDYKRVLEMPTGPVGLPQIGASVNKRCLLEVDKVTVELSKLVDIYGRFCLNL